MKKTIIILMLYLLFFGLFFGVSLYNYQQNTALFEFIGVSNRLSDLSLIVLSIFGILKTGWHIFSF